LIENRQRFERNVFHATGFGCGVGVGSAVGRDVAVGVGVGVGVRDGLGVATTAAALADGVATIAGSGLFGGGVALQAPMTTATKSARGESTDRRADIGWPPKLAAGSPGDRHPTVCASSRCRPQRYAPG
jgi:hypothetical protein